MKGIYFLSGILNGPFYVTDNLFHFSFSCMFLNDIVRAHGGGTLPCLSRFD